MTAVTVHALITAHEDNGETFEQLFEAVQQAELARRCFHADKTGACDAAYYNAVAAVIEAGLAHDFICSILAKRKVVAVKISEAITDEVQ